MKSTLVDLTNAHIHEYPKKNGMLTLRNDAGFLVGVVAGITRTLDPMQKISVSGTQPDGTYFMAEFDVPLSVCLLGPVPIVEYLTKHYAKP